MAAITSAVLGAASLGYGIWNSMEARDQQQDALRTQQAGLARQREGANLQYQLEIDRAGTSRTYAQRDFEQQRAIADESRRVAGESSRINQGIVDTQFAQEGLRKQAMELDAKRQQTEIIRNQQRARALALTTATAQGAQRGTGLQGGYAQISGQSNVNALGIDQQLSLGRNMFNLNAQLAGQRKDMISLENQYAGFKANQQTQRAQMLYDYALINADYQTRAADIQTNYMSQGQGLVNQGQGMYQGAASQAQFGQSFMNLGMNLPGYGMTMNNILGNAGATMSGFNMASFGFNPATGGAGSYLNG